MSRQRRSRQKKKKPRLFESRAAVLHSAARKLGLERLSALRLQLTLKLFRLNRVPIFLGSLFPGESDTMAHVAFQILLVQGVWLASSTDKACSSHGQAEETSFLSWQGGVTGDLWTACTMEDGHATCRGVFPHFHQQIQMNTIQFVSKADHPQLTGLDFFAKRYAVTDGQPVAHTCVIVGPKPKQLHFYVGRHRSSKPAQAFRDHITQLEMLKNYSKHTEWDKMNFVFEGEVSFTFESGQTQTHVVRFGQTGYAAAWRNEWNIAGHGCRVFTQQVEFPNTCLKCGKVCFQQHGNQIDWQYTFAVWPCPEAQIQCHLPS